MPATRNIGISINSATEEKLRRLTEHFKGDIFADPEQMTDDELLAVLLGWYFRNLPNARDLDIKFVLHAFLVRVWNSNGEPHEGRWKFRQIPSKYTRGDRPTSGNILTPTGITPDVLDDICFRVFWVSILAQTLRFDFEGKGLDFESQELLCSLVPDHAIIDACVVGELRSFHFPDDESEKKPFPYYIESEIARRAGQKSWRRPEFNAPDWPPTEGFA